MRNKLGAQCQMDTWALLNFVAYANSRAAMGINVRERPFYQELQRLGVKPLYRHWPNEGWDDPENDARGFVRGFLERETAPFVDLLSGGWVLGYNEYVHAHMGDADKDRADRFASTLIREVHACAAFARHDVHAVVLNINTGHFRDDILCFRRTLAELDRCDRCRLGWHEYDWPTMHRTYCDGLVVGNDGCWQTLRWKVAGRAIREAGYNVKFAITECGIDGGVVPGQGNLGWRKTHSDYNEALRNYWHSLMWYADALERDDMVDFALLFGAGLDPDWDGRGFNVPLELARRIGQYRIYPEVRR